MLISQCIHKTVVAFTFLSHQIFIWRVHFIYGSRHKSGSELRILKWSNHLIEQLWQKCRQTISCHLIICFLRHIELANTQTSLQSRSHCALDYYNYDQPLYYAHFFKKASLKLSSIRMYYSHSISGLVVLTADTWKGVDTPAERPGSRTHEPPAAPCPAETPYMEGKPLLVIACVFSAAISDVSGTSVHLCELLHRTCVCLYSSIHACKQQPSQPRRSASPDGWSEAVTAALPCFGLLVSLLPWHLVSHIPP